MVYTAAQFVEFTKKTEGGDPEYLKSVLDPNVIFKMPGRPATQGLDSILEQVKIQESLMTRSPSVIKSVVTDGTSAVAALITNTVVFKVDLPEFMGMKDIKAGDKVVTDMGGFVLPSERLLI
jgi:hypothetical protein